MVYLSEKTIKLRELKAESLKHKENNFFLYALIFKPKPPAFLSCTLQKKYW